MSKMNLTPAFRYRFSDAAKSAAIFFGIMVLIAAIAAGGILYATGHGARVSGSFSFFGISATIAMFVTGICTIREDVRLMLQNGVGRRTIFTAELLVILTISLLLAVAGELLLAVSQAATASWKNFFVTDIVQIIFFSDMGEDLTLAAHVQSLLCFFGVYACANLSGMFLSLLFYRLNKMWTIIVAIGAPLFVFMGLPAMLAWNVIPDFLIIAVTELFKFSIRAAWTFLITFVVLAALIAAVNWMMLRRAPVKPVK